MGSPTARSLPIALALPLSQSERENRLGRHWAFIPAKGGLIPVSLGLTGRNRQCLIT